MGYKEFMLELFGENILFVDGKHQRNYYTLSCDQLARQSV